MRFYLKNLCMCLVIVRAMATQRAPHFRSYLAQSVYDKMLSDAKLKIMDFSMWYKVHEVCLSESSRSLFVPMNVDEETKQFLDSCFEQADYVLIQVWHSVVKSFLGLFMTQTSINGLLNRGRMFVWSREQARQLLGESHQSPENKELQVSEATSSAHSFISSVSQSPEHAAAAQCQSENPVDQEEIYFDATLGSGASDSEIVLTAHPRANTLPKSDFSTDEASESTVRDCWWSNKVVLDLGAGDGHVTQVLSESAKKVYVTETSHVMRKRLSGKGYTILNVDSWEKDVGDEYFDLITCLNLLDRCDMPISLLRSIYKKLAPSGKLVVAIVLPISPYVETGTADHEPSENLGIKGVMIEDQVNSLIEDVFPSLGFNTLRWTRLPYLCEGDMDQAFYWLSDIVFILNKKEEES